MNDQKIYVLMAKTPNIRAVQVADAFDVDLCDASASLRSLVEVGDVVQHSGIGPNGHQAQMYNLSTTFKRSREGAALIATSTADKGSSALPPVLPAAVAHSATIAQIVRQQPPVPRVATKVDMALAYVSIHTSVSDKDMRTVMGIPQNNAPRAYLVTAIKDGRIARNEAGDWIKGPGTPSVKSPVTPVTAAQDDAVASPAFVCDTQPTATGGATAIVGSPEVAVPAVAATRCEVKNLPQESNATAAGSAFRCGLWSDGVLELQRDGRSLVELTRAEGEHMAAFMGRMLATVSTSTFAGTEPS
jgi:hypothetical protein